jgi:hypothetical protein
MSEETEKRFVTEVNPRQGGKKTMFVLAGELVKKQRQVEQQEKRIKELEADKFRLWEAIKKECRNCFSFYRDNTNDCYFCPFRDFKDKIRRGL